MDSMVIIGIIFQLILLEGILSIDNAAVLGTMVAVLPDDRPVPWPKALRGLGRTLKGVLGNQRMAALKAGLLGAYLGRGLMLFLASLIIQNPWLKLLGAFYLVRLAFENLGLHGANNEAEESARKLKKAGFWMVVLNVELADLAFSLDNVVAAVSLSDQLWIVMIGVALGIVTMRFAAGIFSKLVIKFPILKTAAYILVFNIGVQLFLEDLFLIDIPEYLRFGMSIGIILIALAYEQFKPLQVTRPIWMWVGRGFSAINAVIDWALTPVLFVLKLFFKLVWFVLKPIFGWVSSLFPYRSLG